MRAQWRGAALRRFIGDVMAAGLARAGSARTSRTEAMTPRIRYRKPVDSYVRVLRVLLFHHPASAAAQSAAGCAPVWDE